MKHIIIFDYSNIAYYGFYAATRAMGLEPEMVEPDFRGHLVYFNRKVQEIKSMMGSNYELIFAKDGSPKHKYAIWPEYKARRRKLKCDPKIAPIDLIKAWGSKLCVSPDHEADDVMATIATQNISGHVVVASADKDIWDLGELPNVDILNIHTLKWLEPQQIEKAFKVHKCCHIKLVKTLYGDSSDNIPNVLPRTQKYMIPAINASNGELMDFLEKIDWDKLPDKVKKMVHENMDNIERNYQLVKLNNNCELTYL